MKDDLQSSEYNQVSFKIRKPRKEQSIKSFPSHACIEMDIKQ